MADLVPICLVTGFLGSGKTTFLTRVARTHRDRRMVYLVNEFAEEDVDSGVLDRLGQLAGGPGRAFSISGGSIFCRCKVTDFLGTLRLVHEKHHSPDAPIAGVVIEASGISNPKVVERMLVEARLDRAYRIASIVCIVDPGSFSRLLQTLPPIRSQVEAADLVIVNKADAFDEAALAETEADVRALQPGAAVRRAVRCDVDADLFGPRGGRGLAGELAACRDPNFDSLSVKFDGDVDWPSLRAALEAIRDDLYRVKGFLVSDGQAFYVDYAGGPRVEATAVDAVPGQPLLVVITRGGAGERARRLAAEIENRRYYRQPGAAGGTR
ncbi:MAG: hypothetical protein BIFFINMI_03117 [Phycisphaerae bacterium]|nr:hypothetical protein [Phycisphaerae bacterium]